MKDLADEGKPLHPSGMRNLLVCPWSVVSRHLGATEEDHGAAGDTGSALHVAAAELHRGRRIPECTAKMVAERSRYPLADVVDATGMFLQYAADERNASADVVLVEKPIAFSIAPAPEDPTGERIYVVGTLDQVRRVGNRLELWDVKSTKKDCATMLWQYSLQAAAYCIGASALLGEYVHPGGCVFTRQYAKGRNAHWPFTWSFVDIEDMLLPVRHAVAAIRSGRLWHMPNDNCCYCPKRTPDVCFPALKEYRRSLPLCASS